MREDRQKQRAINLLMAMDRGDTAAVDALISTDFTFQSMDRVPITLKGETAPTILDRAMFLKFGVPTLRMLTQDGMHFSHELAISEGPHVVVIGESNAISASGKQYANCYCWLFRFRDDKISHVKEYRDTHLSRTVLFE